MDSIPPTKKSLCINEPTAARSARQKKRINFSNGGHFSRGSGGGTSIFHDAFFQWRARARGEQFAAARTLWPAEETFEIESMLGSAFARGTIYIYTQTQARIYRVHVCTRVDRRESSSWKRKTELEVTVASVRHRYIVILYTSLSIFEYRCCCIFRSFRPLEPNIYLSAKRWSCDSASRGMDYALRVIARG